MAVSGADLLDTAGGELSPSFWPDKSPGQLEALLDAYVTEGASLSSGLTDAATKDRATKAWAYHLAYKGLVAKLAAQGPASASLNDQGSSTFTGDQFAALQRLADEHKATFDQLVPQQSATPLEIRTSRSVANNVTW